MKHSKNHFFECLTILFLGSLYGFGIFCNITTPGSFGVLPHAAPEERFSVCFFREPWTMLVFRQLSMPGLFSSASAFCFLESLYGFAILWNITAPGSFGVPPVAVPKECFTVCFFWEPLNSLEFWAAVYPWPFLACFPVLFLGIPLRFCCFLQYDNTWEFASASPRRPGVMLHHALL